MMVIGLLFGLVWAEAARAAVGVWMLPLFFEVMRLWMMLRIWRTTEGVGF